MTKPFTKDSELIRFMVIHLNELYDRYTVAEEEGDREYTQGRIDSTHIYLGKSGMQYMEYEDYLELSQADWKKV
jgi:hypothetical protein